MERDPQGTGSSPEKTTEPPAGTGATGQPPAAGTQGTGSNDPSVTTEKRDPAEVGQPGPAPGEDGAAPPSEPKADEPEVEVIPRDTSARALLGELLPELALLAAAIYFFVLAGDFGGSAEPGQLGPGFWPRMAATGLIIALLARIFQTLRARKQPIVRIRSEFEEDAPEAPFDNTRVAIAMGLAVAYVLATMFLGFMISTALFLTVFIWIGGQRRWYVPLVGVGGALVATVVFVGVVYISLPTGVGVFDTVTVAVYELLGLQ
jgi:putative tricarboxylic transport membrane protein